jgi:hypothetical protein
MVISVSIFQITIVNKKIESVPDACLEKRHRVRKEIDPPGNHQSERHGQ